MLYQHSKSFGSTPSSIFVASLDWQMLSFITFVSFALNVGWPFLRNVKAERRPKSSEKQKKDHHIRRCSQNQVKSRKKMVLTSVGRSLN